MGGKVPAIFRGTKNLQGRTVNNIIQTRVTISERDGQRRSQRVAARLTKQHTIKYPEAHKSKSDTAQ